MIPSRRDLTVAIGHIPRILLLLLFTAGAVSGQRTAVYTDLHSALRDGDKYFSTGLFAQAYAAYDAALQLPDHVHIPDYDLLRATATLNRAMAALRSGHPDGERLLTEFMLSRRPDPLAQEATKELADFYFNAASYEAAIDHYNLLAPEDLTEKVNSEVRFKEGYSHFIRREFAEAESSFRGILEVRHVYYYPANYYYGMCLFYRDDYRGALRSFERVAGSQRYGEFVPYYITQIHFTQGDYTEVIRYAEQQVGKSGVRNKEEIRLLLGRAYFETGNYAVALPHLEAYESHARQLSAEDFYQLAFAQYQTGNCTGAIRNFLHVATQDNVLGQRASFYLADCYLKTGDTQGARTAFRNVARMSYDATLRDEAALHYGKVSAQLGYDSDAIQMLSAIHPASRWHTEAEAVLKGIFNNTRDYAGALAALESLPDLSPALRQAYQRLSLLRGIQLHNDGDHTRAVTALENVQRYPVDAVITAQALYWRSEITHANRDFRRSIDLLNQYFTLIRNTGQLPVEASAPLAHYTQGYNYIRQENYPQAQQHFQDAIDGIRQDSRMKDNTRIQNAILPDAMVRTADCAFKRNRYREAASMYDEVIRLGGTGMVYARFQRAMIEGLERRPGEKIRMLEALVSAHPSVQLADEALFQLAVTYQETGRPDRAIPALEQLIRDHPRSSLHNASLLRLGLMSYNNGDYTSAVNYYKRVFAHQPTANEGREALAALEEIYVKDLRTPDAYFDFASTVPGYEISALRRDSITFRVAEIQYERGEYAVAADAFADYLTRFPRGIYAVAALFYRADALTFLNRFGEALSDLEAVIGKGPGRFYQDALKKAALLSYNAGRDFNKAYDYYIRLHRLTGDPEEHFEIELGLLRSAYRAGKLAESIEWSDKVTAQDKASSDVRAEANFYGAKALFEQKQYPQALDRFNQVVLLSNNVQTAEARYRIAQIYYLEGHPDLAEQLCQNANEANANYPYWVAKSLILLADIAVDRGDLFRARAPLEAVIEHFAGDDDIVAEARQKLEHVKALEQQQSRIRQDTSKTLPMQVIDEH